MRRIKLAAIAIPLSMLSACASIEKHLEQSVGADDLDSDIIKTASSLKNSDATDKLQPYKDNDVLAVARDSLEKCTNFLEKLVSTENSVNVGGDIISGGLSTAGALVAPVATAHALSASAAAVISGKSSINTDIYAQSSVANFQNALKKTYFSDLQSYLNNFTHANIPNLEIAKIQNIHSECTIAAAEVYIGEQLAKSGQSTPNK